jgi:uncharacterized membrane-anchored protein YitT (DUF2179 family)
MKMSLSKADVLGKAKNLGLVILGTLVLAFGCAIFVVPFELVSGGVTGLSIVIDNIFKIGPVSIPFLGTIPFIDVIVAVITWLLFFLGLIVLGWDFSIKTLTSTIIYPIALPLFGLLVSPDVLNGVFYLAGSEYADIALIISAIMGGLCVGAGCALTFLGGGSTGGVDIIAFIICKYMKRWKSSTVIFVVDATTVVLGLFVIQDLILTLLGIVSAWIAATVIDRIFIGSSRAFTAQIVSEKYEEINLAIRNEVRRTTTLFVAEGGYSREHKTVIMVTFTMPQYADLMRVIKRVDPTAFVSISRAHEINGEGFTYGHHD